MAYKIYFSDTSAELDAVRPVLFEQIRDAGMLPVELDTTARQHPETITAAVRERLSAADGFISIVTYRRGWVPVEGGPSLAEIEYHVAQELGKPAAILMPDPNSEMAMYLRQRALGQAEAHKQEQQTFWKELAGSAAAAFFSDEADLSSKVMQLLRDWAVAMSQTIPETRFPLERSPQHFQPSIMPPALDMDTFANTVADRTAVKLAEIQQNQQKELAEQTLKYNEALRIQPGELVFGRPSKTRQFKSDIFMIMPFAPEFSSIYTDVVRPLVTDLGLTVSRGDEFQSSRGVIMEEVWAALNACRFVIAEITGGNDNVYYELGIAHTLNKPAIMITQATSAQEVPFDIRHLRYIHYANTVGGGIKLSSDLRTAITRLLADLEEGWPSS
jgi:nucleoside 2-deoxyribosyltransferase